LRPISDIALDIQKDWADPSPNAQVYLRAMFFLQSMRDAYRGESAADILRYFLANAGKWNTPLSRKLKGELRALLSSSGSSRAARLVVRYLEGERK
jgi:hypothetical protein